MRKTASPEFPKLKNNAYRIRAGVDVLMPGNLSYFNQRYRADRKLEKSININGCITRGELQRSAINVLNSVIKRV